MPPAKVSHPHNAALSVDGASIHVADLKGKPYETITVGADHTVTETMAEGYVPNPAIDYKADLLVLRLQTFVNKHKAYQPDPAALVALFAKGSVQTQNRAKFPKRGDKAR